MKMTLKNQVSRSTLFFYMLGMHIAVCSSLLVTGTVGENVMLPCVVTYKDPFLLRDLIVNWQTENYTVVHSFHYGKDQPDYQAKEFKGRTQMFPQEFPKGNVSLLLLRVKSSDAGFYICHVVLKHMHTRRSELVVKGSRQDIGRHYWTAVGAVFIPLLIIIGIKFNRNRHRIKLPDDIKNKSCENKTSAFNDKEYTYDFPEEELLVSKIPVFDKEELLLLKISLFDYIEIYRRHIRDVFLSTGECLINCIPRTVLIPEWRTGHPELRLIIPKTASHNISDVISSEDLFTWEHMNLTSSRMLLAGEAGIGKSSFSQGLLKKWALSHHIGYDCIIYFTFTELNSIEEPISVNALLGNKCEELKHVLPTLLETKKVLIIFDGMDEFKLTKGGNVPFKTNVTNETKLSIEKLVLNILCKVLLPHTDILVTSRFTSANLSMTRGFFEKTFILKEFSDDEIKLFCMKYCSADEMSQSILHFIQEHNLSSLASIPLLSSALCELSKSHQLSRYKENLRTRSEMMASLLKHCLMNAMPCDMREPGREPCHATATNEEIRDLVHRVAQLSYENLVAGKEEIKIEDLSLTCLHAQQLLQELCFFFFKKNATGNVLGYRHASIRDMFAALHCVWEIQGFGGAKEYMDCLDFWVSGKHPDQQTKISILQNIPSGQSVEFHNFISFFMGFMNYKDIDSLCKEKRELNSYEVLILQNYFETWVRKDPTQAELLKLLHCIYEIHNEALTSHLSSLFQIVDLFNTPLNALDIIAMQYSLQKSRLDMLNLNLCDLQDENLQRLEVIIQNSTNVLLTSNMLTSKSGKTFGNILEDKKCAIKVLHLSVNQLGPVGVQQVWKALEINTSLETLNLCDNDIQDVGTENMVPCLKMNTTLKKLILCMNSFTEDGMKNITELITNQPNLKVVTKTTKDDEFLAFVEDNLTSNKWKESPKAWVLYIISLLWTDLSNENEHSEKVARLKKKIAGVIELISANALQF